MSVDESAALRAWAKAAGSVIADRFSRQRKLDPTLDPRAFVAREIGRGGPLLGRLREHAESGFHERLAEIGGGT